MAGARDFSLFQSPELVLRAHPATFPRGKEAGA